MVTAVKHKDGQVVLGTNLKYHIWEDFGEGYGATLNGILPTYFEDIFEPLNPNSIARERLYPPPPAQFLRRPKGAYFDQGFTYYLPTPFSVFVGNLRRGVLARNFLFRTLNVMKLDMSSFPYVTPCVIAW